MVHYPKILFITPVAFNRVTGSGITYSALFKNWPKDCLATVHNDPEPTITDVCDHYFVISPQELNFGFPFNYLRRINRSNQPAKDITTSNSVQISSSLPQRIFSKVKATVLSILGDSLPEKAVLTPELEEWINEFNPDVIYTVLGSNGMMELIEQVRIRFDLPVVVHIMDDWVSAIHENGLLAPFARKKMQRLVQHFMNISTTRLSISPAMSLAYEQRYGHGFEPFQNTIDTQKWLPVAQDKSQTSKTLDILYVGSIFHNAQLQSLNKICQVIGDLSDQGKDISLTLSSPSGHTAKYQDQLAVHPAIKIEDTIRDDDIFFNRIAKADVLLLPVNFDEESVRFIKYSMPTKVPAYLTVGTPILLYAPAGIAQVEYAREEEWGLVIDDPDVDKLKKGLLEICENTELRQKLSKTAKIVAQRNHDAKTVRKRFQQVLIEAAQTSK